MDALCVYCGSSSGERPAYAAAAADLGTALAERDVTLVYGGGRVGLMGAVADAALAAGGDVHGVIPESLEAKEVAHSGLTDLDVVASMHERKARMAELADGFVALPGGFGTLEEIVEVLTWAQLGFHEKPCGLLNVAGYYDDLAAFFDHQTDEGFVEETHREMVVVEDSVEDLLDAYASYESPPIKSVLTDAEET
ncbi:TIGR00730 family Rossman fold protein [Halarchaeum sp. CBA1220]|uniref:LOG family protein n=1 Tax=Halarchaeum sp. CBA1220 TaxID=1853682 RepID=UPI000F3A8071|nr:TIGR00730 family Rossman fold protein [Halarchaeum sp. CBA1220]QLC34148.1 TIGR00730 family Rossman fold protein [Halarchaeum sp. CBA1220]